MTDRPQVNTNAEVKKQRTPRTTESITAGAMALPLAQRTELCKRLKESILKEVQDKEAGVKLAKELITGL